MSTNARTNGVSSLTPQSRRLPGVRFEVQPPPLVEALPRMDVAVFVGFAASGPIDLPVVVEDGAQFEAIFGGDVELAWDRENGAQVKAHLGPAVRAFFRNGGRRCWVVRVASATARQNLFPVPGLTRLSSNGTLVPAYARARSKGSWSDPLQADTALASRPVVVTRFDSVSDFELELSDAEEVIAGDLLRLVFADDHLAMVAVRSVKLRGYSSVSEATRTLTSGAQRLRVRVEGGAAQWFHLPGTPPRYLRGRARVLTSDGRRIGARVAFEASDERSATLRLRLDKTSDAPSPGSFVRASFGEQRPERLWLYVEDVRALGRPAGSTKEIVQVTGESLWWLKREPEIISTPSPPLAEKLLFELRVRRSDGVPTRISDLAFSAGHPRFWSSLPRDEQLYRDPYETGEPGESELWQAASNPRFPLAGRSEDTAQAIYFPVAMQGFSGRFLGPLKSRSNALRRDGLATFSADLFLDPALKRSSTELLLAQADFLRYQSPTPRRLRGIHAALSIEEATIIAVPDAVHRGWSYAKQETESEASGRVSPPALSPSEEHERTADAAAEDAEAQEPHRPTDFLDCQLATLAAPTLDAGQRDEDGLPRLEWSAVHPEAEYQLEESPSPDESAASPIYRGTETSLTIRDRREGTYYYRVRAEARGSVSGWSAWESVRVVAARRWQLKPATSYQSRSLREVQCALLRMCAARGDLFAPLALPAHYREEDAVSHVSSLKPFARTAQADLARAGQIAPLRFDELRALSYGALYHPWLIGREETATRPDSLERIPPDGAAAGSLARRSLERGAWIAPANLPLRGVVALAPAVERESRLTLQEAQVNLIRQEPQGFLALSADTLSELEELRPIGVRRLLSLLRRLALRLGSAYVFEPNSDAFRRLVKRGFEGMLGEMFARGAFAGRTPDTSFRVVTDSELNTPQLADQGRFIVELKVAPSLPLTFLSIRLVQAGDRGLATEER